ncbi:hypothetical protein [Corynebacterium glyciniphilum]|uniref:hypothetical protein n=1 Tax=Corynebacterium glyciniphilum TaxID=1404244 RepID=UPI0011AB661D|nr:hypothetical protein [Corynebacterium glyciniphilum]
MGKNEELTLREAVSERYGAHSTLRKHIAEGNLAASKNAEGKIVMRREDLDAWKELRDTQRACGGQVDPRIKARARVIAAEAPRLSEAEARAVATILVKGGAAA